MSAVARYAVEQTLISISTDAVKRPRSVVERISKHELKRAKPSGSAEN